MSSARWLDGVGGLWLARCDGETLSTSVCCDGILRDELVHGAASGGWNATVDTDGTPWIVWSDGAVIRARRAPDGAWGPPLQVSTSGPDTAPLIIPDTYGNVWIFWWRSATREVWMCRMGPRSGQETRVAEGVDAPALAVHIIAGTLYVALPDGRAVVGTENEGFSGLDLRTRR